MGFRLLWRQGPVTNLAQRSQITGVDALADHHCVPAFCDIVLHSRCVLFPSSAQCCFFDLWSSSPLRPRRRHSALRPPRVVIAASSSRLRSRPPVVRAEADRPALERCRRALARRRPSSSSRAPQSPLVVRASSPRAYSAGGVGGSG